MKKDPYLYWVTGYPGAGKSSIARATAARLRQTQANVVLLDGDEFRELFGDLSHSPDDRLRNAWRIARVSAWLSRQGIEVVTATVSMYSEVREWLRTGIPGYREIYVKASRETLGFRDQKGLYSAEDRSDLNVAGVDLIVEEPTTPDLILSNDENRSNFDDFVTAILSLRKE